MTDIKKLEKLSMALRKNIFTSVYKGNGGHIGGAFSVIDILTFLYSDILNIDCKDPENENRDRLIFSKGHSCLALYWTLSQFGFFDKSLIENYGRDGANFAGHPEFDKAPGIEISSGSLGHGPAIGAGIAYAGLKYKKNYKVFVIVGDGETNEGSVWESLMCASQLHLSNFYLIVDNNGLESLDKTNNIMSIEPIDKRLEAFNFIVERGNGHDFKTISSSINNLMKNNTNKPRAFVADTVKANGISFMQGQTKWHYRAPNEEEYLMGIKELEDKINA